MTLKRGPPSSFSLEIADQICEHLIEGLSLRKIALLPGMPSRATVLRWLEESPEFEAKYARARESQADLMDDLILDTAAEATAETSPADRVKIMAYQWRAERLKPKKYGNKLAHVGGGKEDPPIKLEHDLSGLTDEELAALERINEKIRPPA